MHTLTESEVENIGLSYLEEQNYSHLYGPDISPDGIFMERQYGEVVLVNRLRDAIDRLNPQISDEGKADAIKKVLRTDSPGLLVNNETFHKYLTEGIEIELRKDGSIRGDKVNLVDFNDPEIVPWQPGAVCKVNITRNSDQGIQYC